MLISEQDAVVTIATNNDGANYCETFVKISLIESLFGKRIAVGESRKIGQRYFFHVRQVSQRNSKIGQSIERWVHAQLSGLIAAENIAKTDYWRVVIYLELDAEPDIAIVSQRTFEGVLRNPVIESTRNTNRSEVLNFSGD